MDHVGIGAPVNGDSIYNGADDDASGTTGVIELAEALSRPGARPKRSVIFLTVSGEEHGLWGSGWFSEHPAVPMSQIIADLNIDMIGRNWKDTIVVIGKEHSDLGATLDRVNRAHPELDMKAIDDIWPEENFYFRSDHYNFARKGVPILFFFNGTHPDYHGPNDEPDRIEYRQGVADRSADLPDRAGGRERAAEAGVEPGELQADRSAADAIAVSVALEAPNDYGPGHVIAAACAAAMTARPPIGPV